MPDLVPELPDGWVFDPGVDVHRPEIGVWWVIMPDGTRTAWHDGKGEDHATCPVCRKDPLKQPNCDYCTGRGVCDHIPYCDRPWDEITTNLWLGGHDCQPAGAPPLGDCYPKDLFDLVVSLHHREGFEPTRGMSLRYTMPDGVLDHEDHAALDRLSTQVVRALDRDQKVLVRCQAGINRAALVTGLALVKMGWTPEEAILRMRKVRSPWVLFNKSFAAHLMAQAPS